MAKQQSNNAAVPVLALRPADAARALGVSERWLWSATKAGLIPHVRAGRAVLYAVGALEQWLAEQAAQKNGGADR